MKIPISFLMLSLAMTMLAALGTSTSMPQKSIIPRDAVIPRATLMAQRALMLQKAIMPAGMVGDFFGGSIIPDWGFNLIGSGSIFGSLGSYFSPTSFLGGGFNRVKYCVINSKVSYSCVLPNIKFFIYTQLVSFPSLPFIGFLGPLLSTVNIVYLLLNYLPYILKDTVCIVKGILLGGILPVPSLPLPSLPHNLTFPLLKTPFLVYLNQTLGDQINFNDTLLIQDYSDLDRIF